MEMEDTLAWHFDPKIIFLSQVGIPRTAGYNKREGSGRRHEEEYSSIRKRADFSHALSTGHILH